MPPTGEPLVGAVVRLDVMSPPDAPGLFEVYGDPACYQHGYLMSRRHVELGVRGDPAQVAPAMALLRSLVKFPYK